MPYDEACIVARSLGVGPEVTSPNPKIEDVYQLRQELVTGIIRKRWAESYRREIPYDAFGPGFPRIYYPVQVANVDSTPSSNERGIFFVTQLPIGELRDPELKQGKEDVAVKEWLVGQGADSKKVKWSWKLDKSKETYKTGMTLT